MLKKLFKSEQEKALEKVMDEHAVTKAGAQVCYWENQYSGWGTDIEFANAEIEGRINRSQFTASPDHDIEELRKKRDQMEEYRERARLALSEAQTQFEIAKKAYIAKHGPLPGSDDYEQRLAAKLTQEITQQ